MNPRLANHQTHDLLNGESYSPSPVEIGEAIPQLVERESAGTAAMLVFIMRERRFVAKALVIGMVVAAIISLIIRPEYESTSRIMPPEKQGLGGLAAMLAAAGGGAGGGAGSLVGSLVSDAVGIKSSGAIYAGILKSNTVQDGIINQFDLRHVYRVKYLKDARERLSSNTEIDEDRKSGIISITVTDRSRQRAADIANAYIASLDSLTAQLNTSAAHRERLFIEDRLKTAKQDLDDASQKLSDFSSKSLVLDVKEEGKAMVASVATLEGELIAAESQLSGLEQIYNGNHVRVRALQARIASLKGKLADLRGTPGFPDAVAGPGNDFDLSISKLPSLGLTYYDLYRRVKIQETIFEILTKQYELAKIEEAKEIPTIKVLDHGKVPETKTSPKRTVITILGGILAAMLATAYLIGQFQMRVLGASHPVGIVGGELRQVLWEDLQLIRARTPEPILRAVSRLRALGSRKNSVPPPVL